MRIGAVIAAAGVPGGFRAYEKLEHTDRNAMLARMVETFRRAGAGDIAVVTGYRAEETERGLARLGAAFLRYEDYEHAQMLDFAVAGLEYLKKCSYIFFCPADVPLFADATLRQMLDCAMEKDAPVVIPVFGKRRGHPVLIRSDLTGPVAAYRGGDGLKGALDEALDRMGEVPVLLPVDDAGVLVRARREDRFEELAAKEKQAEIYPKVKVRLTRNVPFFGPGMMVLLKQIEALGSVREACEKAGMSYSKGWSLIRTAERELGQPVVERSPGGKNGGRAQVTPAGYELMERYERLEREVQEFAQERYRRIFGKE